MNIKDLIAVVREETGKSHRDCELIVRTAIHEMREHIANGGELNLKGLLVVKRVERKARSYKSMGVTKPAHVRPSIRLSAPLIKAATKEL